MLTRRKLAALIVAFTVSVLVVFLSGQYSSADKNDFRDIEEEGSSGTIFKIRRKTNEVSETEIQYIPQDFRNNGKYIPPRRVVHLDLKGSPPRISYILQLLPIMKKAGATDVLIEYEDMFPFWGPLANLSALNSYTKKDVLDLLQGAEKNGLGVIPLVQTFGHLEFALKLEEYQHIREVSAYPQSICPTNQDAWTLVSTIIQQVNELHPTSQHIHIGCDEVYQVGQCAKCLERLAKANAENEGSSYLDTRYLFLQHVERLAKLVREMGKVPIIWDDMLRNMPKSEIKESGIGELVEPMVWVYVEDIDRFVEPGVWRTYADIFTGLWTASAFKGAFGERLYSVNMYRHFQNQLAWLDVMYRESSRGEKPANIRGIALTGWSRYDHFAALCELLPVAIPSLILSLAVLTSGKGDIHTVRKVHDILQCSSQKSLMLADDLRRNPTQWDLYRCSFPGVKAFSLVSSYHGNKMEIDELYERLKTKDGWMSDWHNHHRFSSPWRVEEAMKSSSYLPGVIRDLERQAQRTLGLYFDKYTVTEWIEQHIQPLSRKMGELTYMLEELTKPKHWPRRPI